MNDIFHELEMLFSGRCQRNAPAGQYTTYRTGGKFEFLVKPKDSDELRLLLSFANKHGMPVMPIGKGSNILVSSKGLPGITVFTGLMNKIDFNGNGVYAQSGAALDAFICQCLKKGLGGYENLSGIPGTIGGALRMNAGAYGRETADFLKSFVVMHPDGREERLLRENTQFSYRHAGFPTDCFVLSAEFELIPGNAEVLLKKRNDILRSRREKQPLEYPSAGSVFRRPPGDYASRLIDSCGLKGLTIGGARVSEKHAGFIINAGNATAEDIYMLINEVKNKVEAKTGVSLETEQLLLGFPRR